MILSDELERIKEEEEESKKYASLFQSWFKKPSNLYTPIINLIGVFFWLYDSKQYKRIRPASIFAF